MRSYKVLLVGDAKRGKSEWVNLACNFIHDGRYVPTQGVEVHPLILDTNKVAKLWDTAGDDRFRGLADGYYVRADIALIFADNEQEAQKWLQEIQQVANNVTIVIITNENHIRNFPNVNNFLVINKDMIAPLEILHSVC